MRTVVILLNLLPFALSFRRDVRRWLLWGGPARRSADFHRRRAERLARRIAALGPTFVKLAQVFAARADLVPEPYLGALGTLLDRVPPAPWPAVEAELRQAYDCDPDALFDDLAHEPLASGSLGQVYRARWQGEAVVVKVLRPGVAELVARDLAAARRILALLERRWSNPHLRGFRMAVEEFARRIGDEMDFELEAQHAIEIAGSFAGDKRVRIPRVHQALTRPRVLVLEYVEGTRVDHIAPLITARLVSGETLVRGVMEIYVRMMLMDGLFHADPHPGNLLIAPDGRIVLLDFGMCVRVPKETRAQLARTVMSAIRKDAAGVANGFHALGIVEPGADPAEIERLVQVLLDLAYSGLAPQDAARVLAEQVMRELYDWPIVLTGEMVYFARAAALIEGLGARYVPNFNSIAFASPIVLRMRREIVAALQLTGGITEADLATIAGAFAGRAARVIADTGRDVAGRLAELVLRVLRDTSLAPQPLVHVERTLSGRR